LRLLPEYILLFINLQLGLCPVAVLQKLDVHTKMGIHRKETKHTSHEKTAYLTKFPSTVQVQWTEYKIQNTEKETNQKNNRIHRNNKTRKQGKSYCRDIYIYIAWYLWNKRFCCKLTLTLMRNAKSQCKGLEVLNRIRMF
jgi:hypothetical protein